MNQPATGRRLHKTTSSKVLVLAVFHNYTSTLCLFSSSPQIGEKQEWKRTKTVPTYVYSNATSNLTFKKRMSYSIHDSTDPPINRSVCPSARSFIHPFGYSFIQYAKKKAESRMRCKSTSCRKRGQAAPKMLSTKSDDSHTPSLRYDEPPTFCIPFENDVLVPTAIAVAVFEFGWFDLGALPDGSRRTAVLYVPNIYLVAGFGAKCVAVRCEIERLDRSVRRWKE